MEHTHTEFVAASPDKVFAALADLDNLPKYVPQLTGAEHLEGEKIKVQARYGGHTQEGEAWFKADAAERKIEWGAPDSHYHGWIQVGAENDGSLLTLHLATVHSGTAEGDVVGTLDSIRRLVESDV